jgi:hypothetical protein
LSFLGVCVGRIFGFDSDVAGVDLFFYPVAVPSCSESRYSSVLWFRLVGWAAAALGIGVGLSLDVDVPGALASQLVTAEDAARHDLLEERAN